MPLKLKNASYPEPDALALVNEYDLGRDGSKWRHGWVPLNPAAVAIKAKRPVGGGGERAKITTVKGTGSSAERATVHRVSVGGRQELGTRNRAKAVAKANELNTKIAPGKSRLSTSTVRPSRAKVAGAKGRASDGKVPVYNVNTDKVEYHSPAEAAAGHARYGQSLGAGTPAAGQTVKNALEAERARRAAAVAEAERTGHVGDASLDDLAKRRTTAELQHIASSMGMGTPEGRAARRELNTRGPAIERQARAKARIEGNTMSTIPARTTPGPAKSTAAAVLREQRAANAEQARRVRVMSPEGLERHANSRMFDAATVKAARAEQDRRFNSPEGQNAVARIRGEVADPKATNVSVPVNHLAQENVNDLRRMAKLPGSKDAVKAELRRRGYVPSDKAETRWVKAN